MSFSESLTVRILGDSSELQRELDSVLNRFDSLKSKIAETSNSARQFSSSFNRVSQALGPLQQVHQAISRISQQLQSLSQRPLTLNAGPALAALQRLTQAAHQAAAAIRAIPPIPIGGATPVGFPVGDGIPPRRLAGGGIVSGRSGIDRVPAQLTAGEYVINRSAVELLGLGFLERLNSSPQLASRNAWGSQISQPTIAAASLSRPRTSQSVASLQMQRVVKQIGGHPSHTTSPTYAGSRLEFAPPATQTNNHFGGITIQVTSPAESESLMRNLQLQGIGQRIRRG